MDLLGFEMKRDMRKLAKLLFIVSAIIIFAAIGCACFADPINNYEFENHSEIPKDNY